MAVAVIVDTPGGNSQIYDQLIPGLFPDGKLLEGWQVHIAGPTENGWRIVNVVPSREQFEAFAREQLNPATQTSRRGNTAVDILSRTQADSELTERGSAVRRVARLGLAESGLVPLGTSESRWAAAISSPPHLK
jgi:hypothetical protein